MALEARHLGFNAVVVPECTAMECEGITVIPGVIIRETTVRDVIRRVRALPAHPSPFVLVNARDIPFNRAVLGTRGVHALRDIHQAPRASFDHVCARTAAERGVSVNLDLRPLVRGRGALRQRAIQRYADILDLSRKFGFSLTIASGARSVLEQRSIRETCLICGVFGMTQPEVEAALGTIPGLLSPSGPVRVVP